MAAIQTSAINIVKGKLKPTAPMKITEIAPKELKSKIKQLENDIVELESESTNDILWKDIINFRKNELQKLKEQASNMVKTVQEYVDSAGAKYKKIRTMNGDGSVHKDIMIKTEECSLQDGRKIITKTTHDKSPDLLMGKGFHEGHIKTVERLEIPNKGVVAERETNQLASGYGGKTVSKTISTDGEAIGKYNTVTSYKSFNEEGICDGKEIIVGPIGMLNTPTYKFEINKKGIPTPIQDLPKYSY